MRRFAVASILASAVVACGGAEPAPDRALYVQRVHRALHPSAPPLSDAEVAALGERSDEELVTDLLDDPRTAEAVFGFSLHFLGAPVDQLRDATRWTDDGFHYSPASAATREFLAGTDPLHSLVGIQVRPSIGPVRPIDPGTVSYYFPQLELVGTQAEQRAQLRAATAIAFGSLHAMVEAVPEPIDAEAFCATYYDEHPVPAELFFDFETMMGVPTGLLLRGRLSEILDDGIAPLRSVCNGDVPLPPRAEMLARVDRAAALYESAYARIELVMADREHRPDDVFDAPELAALGFQDDSGDRVNEFITSTMYPAFWDRAPNSSTNYNRKRAAYVLARYFCDDLLPVGAALPDAHAGDGRHASDPACAACHFKLDPMAGFFRRQGFFGVDFTDGLVETLGGDIIFDDFASARFADYEATWLAAPDAGRTFDVGYIRSTRDPVLNSYGSTLQDLDAILHQAPEVERCVAQRMFEHWNGDDQAVDPGFLDDVAADMRSDPAQRFHRGITRILTGATFKEPARSTSVCYDLAPGTSGDHRPPCEVASILRASCTGCHGPDRAEAGLDLATWVRDDDGAFGFHQVVNGLAVSRTEVFAKMRARITTSDLTLQMPQNQDMPLRTREALALWLDGMLAN